MNERDIAMEQINPFVRYVHTYSVGCDTSLVNVIPYDCRCVYILEGRGCLALDGSSYPAGPGSLFIWPAGMAYGYMPLSGCPFVALGVNFDYTMDGCGAAAPVPPAPALEFRREEMISPVRFSDPCAFQGAVALQGMFWARDVLQQMEREYRTRRNHWAQRLRGQMLCLLCDAARAQSAAAMPQDGDICDAVLDHIRAHFREDMTNEALSRVFSFHPAYLSRMIKRQTGMPLHRYILHYRLSVAMNLLHTTRLPVAEIAAQSGFSDGNYFCRCFRKQWGRSPGSYRGGA